MNARSHTIVFTDGASSGNPGPGGWGAIVVTTTSRVFELGGGETRTTNNRMELTAVVEALDVVATEDVASDEAHLYVDSTYVIHGITRWSHTWRTNGWKTKDGADVANRELWERLLASVEVVSATTRLRWHHIRGHQGVLGNERCDQIAVTYTRAQEPDLYRGALDGYAIDVTEPPDGAREVDRDTPPRALRPKRGKAHSYVSLVGGKLRRHATWTSCKARVDGQSGARFRKTASAADEAQIVRSWGHDPGDLEDAS